ncbi:MAG TPA: CYTH domain-containing protein [Candidatus Nanoperiomorbaceae bacterium]|nr:CYTH domain-containing protein [Candidatus Nanoperiomorbaceae bacterium]HMQ96785.1 CYTH domain-containing protein [Candidatus Nanoperiomorbaceae bacterium]HMR86190.1 CYTH domain-containing protein [Candidatus Nanoperiomorbaceae bacterium]HMU11938.1 CYTH domain-containing protein [Candidatus Nanoperiomorbaceae bacterium]
MNTEIEVKFIQVNHDTIRSQLQTLGGTCAHPMRLMRRVVFVNEALESRHGWLRVRDEGDRVTVSYKQRDSLDIHGTKEIETVVGDFDAIIQIIRQMGEWKESYQESKRETWQLGEVEVVLDEWPWLDPLIEIEGPSAELVTEVAVKLGFAMKDATYGSVMSAYRKRYPDLDHDFKIGNVSIVKFGDPMPSELERAAR